MAEVTGWVLGAVICMVMPLGLAGADGEDSQNGATGVEATSKRAVTVRDWAEQIVRSIGRAGCQFIQRWTPLRIAGAAVLVLAFLVGTLGYLNERELLYLTETAKQILKYLSANVSTELASIAITILFVDALYQHRETEREKKRLILQMGSHDNAFAVEAVRALRMHGWLENGSLKEAYLREADLQGAKLENADLQGSKLEMANLEGAKLEDVNLQEASLRGANLKGAILIRANLKGADLFFADLQEAFLGDVDLRLANLRVTIFRKAKLLRVNLRGTKYDDATIWPEGFTPPPEAVNEDAERAQNDL